MVAENRQRYLQSLARELAAQATRVRDLIGDHHWLTDGHHKEALLGSLLRRHLPNNLVIGRGFVVDTSADQVCSKEQDLLVVDARIEAPLFSDAGLVIAMSRTVLATISVKTAFGSDEMCDAIAGLDSVYSITDMDLSRRHRPFGAVYFFGEGRPAQAQTVYDRVTRAVGALGVRSISPSLSCVAAVPFRLLVTASGILLRAHDAGEGESSCRVLGFEVGDLGPALLVGSLLEHIALVRGTEAPSLTDSMSVVSAIKLSPAELQMDGNARRA